jgi:hypothetical protein
LELCYGQSSVKVKLLFLKQACTNKPIHADTLRAEQMVVGWFKHCVDVLILDESGRWQRFNILCRGGGNTNNGIYNQADDSAGAWRNAVSIAWRGKE